MQNEYCIGEYDMHEGCQRCKVRQACLKKYNKLMRVLEEKIKSELPQRAKAKDYKELQIIEAQRMNVRDKLRRANKLKSEAREAQYHYTMELNKLLGVEEEGEKKDEE